MTADAELLFRIGKFEDILAADFVTLVAGEPFMITGQRETRHRRVVKAPAAACYFLPPFSRMARRAFVVAERRRRIILVRARMAGLAGFRRQIREVVNAVDIRLGLCSALGFMA